MVGLNILAGGVVLAQLSNPTFKGTVLQSLENYNAMQFGLKSSFNLPFIMKQRLPSEYNGLALYKNHFISHITFSTIEKLVEGGIPQYFHKFIYEYVLDLNVDYENQGAMAFSVDDLSFGFIIWLYTCAISCGVFICEILIFYINRFGRKIVQEFAGLFGFLVLLKERMNFFN